MMLANMAEKICETIYIKDFGFSSLEEMFSTRVFGESALPASYLDGNIIRLLHTRFYLNTPGIT